MRSARLSRFVACLIFCGSLLRAGAALRAEVIPIPNAGFDIIDKPGSPGVTATSFAWYTHSIGPSAQIADGYGGTAVQWSDGTTGSSGANVDIPGWLSSTGMSGIQNVNNGGIVGAFTQGPAFGAPSGSTVVSAAPLAILAANTDYTLQMDVDGDNGSIASPSLLELLANGSPLPTSVVLPAVTKSWQTYSITYPAVDISAYVGDSLTIEFGNGAAGAQLQWDNASLTARTVPEPGSALLLVLAAASLAIAALLRRQRRAC